MPISNLEWEIIAAFHSGFSSGKIFEIVYENTASELPVD